MPRLFWQAPADPEGSEIATLSVGRPPTRQAAAQLSGDDVVYPPPGGGVLRVPVGGGAAAELRGEEGGQVLFWSEADAAWVRTSSEPQDGDVLQWDAVAGRYVYVPLPSLGNLQPFDVAGAPAGVWNFQRTLADISGNGNDLALVEGNAAFADIVPGKSALYVLRDTRYQTADDAPELRLTGDMTALAIIQTDGTPDTDQTIVCRYGSSGETEVNNVLYTLGLEVSDFRPTIPRQLFYFSEHGAGLDDNRPSVGTDSLPPVHNVALIGFRRQSNVIRFYYNGLPFGTDPAAINTPTGGTSTTARFMVGSTSPLGTGDPAANPFLIFGLKVYPRALNDAEVLSEYNRTLGPAFGTL